MAWSKYWRTRWSSRGWSGAKTTSFKGLEICFKSSQGPYHRWCIQGGNYSIQTLRFMWAFCFYFTHWAQKHPRSWGHFILIACNARRVKSVWAQPSLHLICRPHDRLTIGIKLIFRNKLDESGNVIRNKARLVAQGFTQNEGIDLRKSLFP